MNFPQPHLRTPEFQLQNHRVCAPKLRNREQEEAQGQQAGERRSHGVSLGFQREALVHESGTPQEAAGEHLSIRASAWSGDGKVSSKHGEASKFPNSLMSVQGRLPRASGEESEQWDMGEEKGNQEEMRPG